MNKNNKKKRTENKKRGREENDQLYKNNGNANPNPNSAKKKTKTTNFPSSKLITKPKTTLPKCVLLLAGSFSPITYMHLRLLEQARDELHDSKKFEVLGGYITPVGDAYGKKGLAPAVHRVKMVEITLENSDWIALDKWESEQPDYKPTRVVIEHVYQEVNKLINEEVKVLLCCGTDLFASLAKPKVWPEKDLRGLFTYGGLAVLERGADACDVQKAVNKNDLLYEYRNKIYELRQHILNETSSSQIRRMVRRGLSVKYLIPEVVENYIKENKLYVDQSLENKVSIFGNY